MEKDASDTRLADCSAVARDIHRIVGLASASAPLLKGKDAKETAEQIKWYQDLLQNRLLPLITTADLRVADIEFLTTLMLQPVDFVREALQDIVTDSIREAVLESLSRKIVAFLGQDISFLPIGNIESDQRNFLKDSVKTRVQEKLGPVVDSLIDVQAVMDLVTAPYNMIKNMLVASRTAVVDGAVASKFGVKDADELRFSHVIAAQIDAAKGVDKPVADQKA